MAGAPLPSHPPAIVGVYADAGTPLNLADAQGIVGSPLGSQPSAAPTHPLVMFIGTSLEAAAPTIVTDGGLPVPSASASVSAGPNITQIIKQQGAQQSSMNNVTPRNLTIALAALLVFIMFLAHARFLARLFASFHRKRTASAEDAARPAYAFDMAHAHNAAAATAQPRVVAGGDLTKGWILRRGRHGRNVGNGEIVMGSDDDPFSSTHSLPTGAVCQRSALAPPPHIMPFTSRLPFSRVLDSAPFARLPFPFRTGASLSWIVVIGVYLLFTIFASTYRSRLQDKTKTTGFGSDYFRTGVVSMSQVPIAIALGVRGNLPGLLIAKSYNHLRILHKVVGRVLFLTGALHSIFFFVKWHNAGVLAKKSASPVGLSGIIAFVAICLIAVTSLPAVRTSAYGVFKISHYIGVIGLLAGLAAHVEVAVPWCIASGVIYAISIIAQLAKTRVARAELVALSGCTTTLVSIPGITTGWRPGQHVRLRVFNLGLKNAMECHPFTIASAPDCGGMVLMAKVAGNWTTELYRLAASGGDTQPEDGEMGVWKRRATVLIEGPYGGLGNTLPCSFSSVLLIAGGSGITQSLALAQDLVARSPSGVVNARTIDLVWIIKVQQTARAIMPTLMRLVEQARMWEKEALRSRRRGADITLPTALRVHIFVTRVPQSSPLTLIPGSYEKFMVEKEAEAKLFPSAPPSTHGHGSVESDDSSVGHSSDDHSSPMGSGDWKSVAAISEPPKVETAAERARADWLQRNPSNASVARLHERFTNPTRPMSAISAYRGRPELRTIMTSITDETMSRHGRAMTDPSGVFVACCGPQFLVNDARDAARLVTPWKAKAVGGIEYEAEFFGV